MRVTFVPAAAPNAPTADYDLTLLDQDGVDVLKTLGANLSETATTSIVPVMTDVNSSSMMLWCEGPLVLNVSNAGDTKQGRIRLYFKK